VDDDTAISDVRAVGDMPSVAAEDGRADAVELLAAPSADGNTPLPRIPGRQAAGHDAVLLAEDERPAHDPVGAMLGELRPVQDDDLPSAIPRDERDASALRSDRDSADDAVGPLLPIAADGAALVSAPLDPGRRLSVRAEGDRNDHPGVV